MGFTTPCFIRKNTPELRKKLEYLGYSHGKPEYYADDDEIQFNLAGQEGVITIPAVISYDKIDEEDLFEDSVAGYTATLESGDTVTFYCFNAKNKS